MPQSPLHIPYCEALGSLMWLQVTTRPDLSFAINLLARGDGVAGILRCRLYLGGCLEATTSGEQSFWRAGYDRGG